MVRVRRHPLEHAADDLVRIDAVRLRLEGPNQTIRSAGSATRRTSSMLAAYRPSMSATTLAVDTSACAARGLAPMRM